MKNAEPDLSRRNFLRGKIRDSHTHPEKTTARIITFESGCMALQGVMCRTCGDRCETGAIRFMPQAGGLFPPQLSTDLCTGCGDCIPDCPTQAIRFVPKNG